MDKPINLYQVNMTLRDYFAAAVINGLMAKDYVYSDPRLAERAYVIAQYMLKEREKYDTGA